MGDGEKRVALVLYSLSKKDQRWMLSQLDSNARGNIKAHLSELSKNKKIAKLGFEEVLRLGHSNETNEVGLSDKSQRDSLNRLVNLNPINVERTVVNADAYTKWLLLASDKIPHRTIIAKTLTKTDSEFFAQKAAAGDEALPWLSNLAVDWLLKEASNESV